jgi:FkbM family methyltransferase
MSNSLTVIIPCKNEREHIAACVASARQMANEVLVADSGSTDGTADIARSLGCRIIEREYGTSGDFKNWAIPQAAHKWVFILDADERIAPQLADEIRAMLNDPRHDGYWVYRRNHFMGHPIRFGPWRNDRCLRLFKRDLGRYVGPTDHAEVELASGTVGRVRERLTHYTCSSYSQYLPKLSRYADVQARIWQQAGRRAKLRHLLFRFPLRFLQGYVLRLGFLDGLAGLQVCVLVAYLSWLKQAYLWQLQSGKEPVELKPEARARAVENSLAGAAGSEPETGGKLSWRDIRRRVTPGWLRTDARRQRRNIFVRKLGYQRCFTPPVFIRNPSLFVRSSLRYVVANELISNPRMTFLQIGAFDGACEDDLRELVTTYNLRGVLVEPQPGAFARLQQTYRNQRQVTLLQAAIAETEGTRELYSQRGPASMTASFDKAHLRKHGIREYDIVAQTEPCHTVASALCVAGLDQVDLIQIDAEGYDWPIIRSIDFARVKPRIIRFEYRHMSDADADACISHLASQGYRFVLESHDIIAVRVAEAATSTSAPKRRSA